MKKVLLAFLFICLVTVNVQAQQLIESLDNYLVKGNTIQYLKENMPITEDGHFLLETDDDGWVDIDKLPSHQVPVNKNKTVNNGYSSNRVATTGRKSSSSTIVNGSFAKTFAKSFAKGFAKGFTGTSRTNVRRPVPTRNTPPRSVPVRNPQPVPSNNTPPANNTSTPVNHTPAPINYNPIAGNMAKGGTSNRITNANIGLNYDRLGKGSKINYSVALGTINNQTFKIAGDITSDETGNKLNMFLKYVDGNTNSQISINLLMNVVNTVINQLQIGLQYNENPDRNGIYTQDNLQKLIALRQELSNKKNKVENTVSESRVNVKQFFPAKGE